MMTYCPACRTVWKIASVNANGAMMFLSKHKDPITKRQRTMLMAWEIVADVEWEGMDEGRFFVHLKSEYFWPRPYHDQHTKSFGSYAEAVEMLKCVQR